MPTFQATKPIEVTDLLSNNGNIAIIFCYATWGPSSDIAPFLESQCQQNDIPLIKVDVDKSPELTKWYNIKAMPTYVVVKDTYDHVEYQNIGPSQNIVKIVVDKAKRAK